MHLEIIRHIQRGLLLLLSLSLPIHAASTIETDPAGAHIRVNNLRAGISPARVILQPGIYLVTANLNGYYAAFKSITVTEDPREEPFRLELEAIPSTFLIQTTPPSGQVTMNGQARGLTPLLLRGMQPGLLAGTIHADGYAPLHIRYNLNPGDTTILHLQMQRESAEITIESNPSGAQVLLDGTAYGTTPLRLADLPAGETTMAIQQQGYRTFSETLTLRTGESRHLNVSLLSEPGTLTITSHPERARVSIDGSFRGRTPLTLLALPPGAYELALEHPAYRTIQTNVMMTAGDRLNVSFKMEVTGGTLTVTTTPPGARVLMNEIAAGETRRARDSQGQSLPLVIHPLAEGEHEIRIFSPGNRLIKETITVSSHEYIERNYTLVPLDPNNPDETTPETNQVMQGDAAPPNDH